MKKTYKTPRLNSCNILCKQMLLTASNRAVLRETYAEKNSEGNFNNEVKSSYNVWDDDWSK